MIDINQEKPIEGQLNSIPKLRVKKIVTQMEKGICRIYLKNSSSKGTGFFCKIKLFDKILPVLITNNHVLNEHDLKNNKSIKLFIDQNVKEIEINDSRRIYTDKEIDITIIEINEDKDGIKYYLELDEDDLKKNEKNIELEYVNKQIYILHYPKGNLSVSYGFINSIENNESIYHKCSTERGSSGSPILSLDTLKVIGIHRGCFSDDINFNYGIFIKCAIDFIKKIKAKIHYPKNPNEEVLKPNENTKNYSHNNSHNFKQIHSWTKKDIIMGITNIRKNLKEFPEYKPLVHTPLNIGKIKLEKPITSDKLINDISKFNGRKKFINQQLYNVLTEKEKQKNECNRKDNTPSLGKAETERYYSKDTYKENKKFINTVSCFYNYRNKNLDNEKNNSNVLNSNEEFMQKYNIITRREIKRKSATITPKNTNFYKNKLISKNQNDLSSLNIHLNREERNKNHNQTIEMNKKYNN